MNKSIFEITKMDCPSEENLIRMKLDGISSIANLDFDIQNRKMTVFHSGGIDQIEKSIIELNLGGQRISTEQTDQTNFDENKNQKKRIAKLAGYFQITLAIIGFVEVLRRFIGDEKLPDFSTMISVSIFALIANGICLYMLQKSKSKEEAHMKASMIFTSNDVIINLGVIIAGIMVNWLSSNKPDLIIGTIVFALVIQGAFRILELSK